MKKIKILFRFIRLEIYKKKKKIQNKIEIYKKKFKDMPYSMKFLVLIGIGIYLEFMLVIPFLLWERIKLETTTDILYKKDIFINSSNKISFKEFLEENKNKISNTIVLFNKNNKTTIAFEIKNKIYNNKKPYLGIEGLLFYQTQNILKPSKDYEVSKIYYFNNILTSSYVYNYEPLLLSDNIKYTTEDVSTKKTPFVFTHFIIENSLRILLIFVFLYLFEKQGLFGNKEKYSIVQPDDVDVDFKHLIGMKDIKSEIYILADLIQHRDKYKELGIDKTFNYMFSGPPGTGKTKIASGLAKLLDVPMIVGTGNVETGYINGGVAVIQELFETAKEQALENKHRMAIIFLDEAQNLMVKRGQSRDKWADDSANELLAQLDGIHTYDDVSIIFIAASNFDDKNHEFDEAMMRRFKKKIFFRLPNFEERKEIIEFYLSKVNKKYLDDKIDTGYLADITANLSPAILETIVQEASLLAITHNKDLSNYEKNKIQTNSKNIDKDIDIDFFNNLSLITTSLLEKAFERISVGQTNRETTKNKDVAREIISKHELGHFVCEMQNVLNKKYTARIFDDLTFLSSKNIEEDIKYLSDNLKVLKISVESISQIKALGYVLNKQDDVLLSSKKELENEIIALYGGLAAENVFADDIDDITTGSSNDIEKVSNILNTMVNKLGMYSSSKLNLNLIDNIDVKEQNSKILFSKSEELFEISKKYVENYKGLIEYLNEILLDKYVLNLPEILELIKDYYLENNLILEKSNEKKH
jgi:cell division protease FtsH